MKNEAERAEARRQAREAFDREYGGAEAAASHGARAFGERQGEPAATSDRPDLYGIEARCAQEFAASPALRDEFGGNPESYTAYRKAEARGRVRIFGGKHREA